MIMEKKILYVNTKASWIAVILRLHVLKKLLTLIEIVVNLCK